MKVLHCLFLAAGFGLAGTHPATAIAAPAVAVEAVQMPAWVEHGDGRKAPLSPGMELNAGDRVSTGSNSRVLLKLSEGSLVKLGENGVLKIDELRPDEGGIFKAVLKVAEGAFRFTTNVLMKHRRRLVNISVANVTTGIRGTDLWGKAASNDRQVVCLIEGSIEVAAEGEKPVLLDQPRQFYQRNQGETAPVGLIDAALLAQWAQETEIAAGQGAARAGGKWKVTLLSAATQEGALAVYAEVRANGYAAEIHPAKAGDRRVYNVLIGHLPSEAEAEALAAQLKGRMGVADPKVST